MLKNDLTLGMMIFFSPAKINLGLQVLGRRRDGYHHIRTIMYPVGLCDILEIKEIDSIDGLRFSHSGIPVDTGKDKNLCIRAWELFRKEVDLPPLAIHLHKQIPVGAGLGGGSSNATHTLLGINRLMGEMIPEKKLHQMASSLGSDCPFFLYGMPMVAEGRGEILNPLPLELEGMCLVLFFTGIHISTAEAYGGVQPVPDVPDLREIQYRPVTGWKEFLKNDFEIPVYRKYPELELMKRTIYRAGALYASLSGSGSALYGLFQQVPDLPGELKRSVVWKEIL